MARVPYIDPDTIEAVAGDARRPPINLHLALAHSITGRRAFGGLGHWIRHDSKLDPKLRELAILQVGWLAKSPYEWSHHVKIGKDFGLNDAEIEALKQETAGQTTDLPELTRLALKGAREMATDGGMSEATYQAIAAHLDHELMVELVLTVGFYCGVVRVLASLGIDVEDSYQPYLDAHPLPE